MGKAVHVMLFIVASISIGLASIFIRLSNASPIACAFWRLLIASIIIAFSPSGSTKHIFSKHTLYPFLAGIALATHFVLWMDSLFRVSVAVSTTIVVLYPIHLAIVETLKGEKPSILEVAGIVMGFASVITLSLYTSTHVGGSLIGVAESFAASIAAAIYFYIGKISRKFMALKEYAVTAYASASITTLLYSFIAKDNVFSYIPKSWPWLLALAVVPMIGGHTTMNYLLKFYKSSTVTSIALAEPAIASALAVIILGENMTTIHGIALALAISGTWIVLKSSKQ
ncbi:DMT family transporter [Ignisphaera sp. 4213-co]|uniref:DMT family transporter n=1 Tax=Ignisphaera cupida TaxID=3050454 RepID=A0ABD4Z9A3_9CREN|nr:DMT family transporter [Ignisphaera sp. 4213-co]MDK6028673.1 DMT family transporter [Ignisphaera sp. 4213-co]